MIEVRPEGSIDRGCLDIHRLSEIDPLMDAVHFCFVGSVVISRKEWQNTLLSNRGSTAE